MHTSLYHFILILNLFCSNKLSTHLSTFKAANRLFHKHAEAQLKKACAYEKTSSGEQRCVSFSSLFCCGCCSICGCHCHHGGRGHCCCDCVDAHESSLISLIHHLSVEIGKILNLNYLQECASDGRMNSRMD